MRFDGVSFPSHVACWYEPERKPERQIRVCEEQGEVGELKAVTLCPLWSVLPLKLQVWKVWVKQEE